MGGGSRISLFTNIPIAFEKSVCGLLFFFSSRRRHTRYIGDWSSDVCSSDLTMAAHVAAMAPATNIGAAHPVALSGGVDKESMKKIESDAAAFIRTVALERGRNADWAEKAVRQSVSITEREAVQLKVVDLIAASVPELLDKIDGRTVKTIKGPRTLATRGAPVKPIEVGFRDRSEERRVGKGWTR